MTAAHRQIRATSGLVPGSAPALVHLDLPCWFGGQQEVPCLRELARALRLGHRLAFRYASAGSFSGPGSGFGSGVPRSVGPLGLVNKAGTWYLVAASEPSTRRRP
jgi:predicted DNA-binding transcriptional regulator YafY